MDLGARDFSFFLAVERAGSFGRAATELMVTQPAVSERIRHLERVVGLPVFERTTRGATLTPAGSALLPYAQRCVALNAEALEAVRRAGGSPSIVLGVHSTFAPRVVPWLLGALRAMPRRVSIRDYHSEQVPALVLDGVLDIGVALKASAPKGIARVGLPDDPVVCAVSTDHALRRKRRASLADLADCVIAVNAWGDGSAQISAKLSAAGVEDWRIRYCADAATAVALARDHDHVAFIAKSALRSAQGLHVVALPAFAGWTVRLDLLFRRAQRTAPEISAVLEAIADA
jgi:DNA-binding transcriptional LysR family regulator